MGLLRHGKKVYVFMHTYLTSWSRLLLEAVTAAQLINKTSTPLYEPQSLLEPVIGPYLETLV